MKFKNKGMKGVSLGLFTYDASFSESKLSFEPEDAFVRWKELREALRDGNERAPVVLAHLLI